MSVGIRVYRKGFLAGPLATGIWKDDMEFGPQKMDWFLHQDKEWATASLTFHDGATITMQYEALGTVLLVNMLSRKHMVIKSLEQAAYIFSRPQEFPAFLDSTLLLGRLVGLTEQSYTTWSDVVGLDATLRAVWPILMENAPKEAGVLRQLLFASLSAPMHIFQQYVPLLMDVEHRLCEPEVMQFYNEKLPHVPILDNLRHLSDLISSQELSKLVEKVNVEQKKVLKALWDGNNLSNWESTWRWKNGPTLSQWVGAGFFKQFETALKASHSAPYGFTALSQLQFFAQHWHEILTQLERNGCLDPVHLNNVKLYATSLRESNLLPALVTLYNRWFSQSINKTKWTDSNIPAFEFAYSTMCCILASMRLDRSIATEMSSNEFLSAVQKSIIFDVFNPKTVPSLKNPSNESKEQIFFDQRQRLAGKLGTKQDARYFLRLSLLATLDHLLQAGILGLGDEAGSILSAPAKKRPLYEGDGPDPDENPIINPLSPSSPPFIPRNSAGTPTISSRFIDGLLGLSEALRCRDLLANWKSWFNCPPLFLSSSPSSQNRPKAKGDIHTPQITVPGGGDGPTDQSPPCCHPQLFSKPPAHSLLHSQLQDDTSTSPQDIIPLEPEGESRHLFCDLLQRWSSINTHLLGPIASLANFAVPPENVTEIVLCHHELMAKKFDQKVQPKLLSTPLSRQQPDGENGKTAEEKWNAERASFLIEEDWSECPKTVFSTLNGAAMYDFTSPAFSSLFESVAALCFQLKRAAWLATTQHTEIPYDALHLLRPVSTWLLSFIEQSSVVSMKSFMSGIPVANFSPHLEEFGLGRILLDLLASSPFLLQPYHGTEIEGYIGNALFWRDSIPRTINLVVRQTVDSTSPPSISNVPKPKTSSSRRPLPLFKAIWDELVDRTMQPLSYLPDLNSILDVVSWCDVTTPASAESALKVLSNFQALLPRLITGMIRTSPSSSTSSSDMGLRSNYYISRDASNPSFLAIFSGLLIPPRDDTYSQVQFSCVTLAAQILRYFRFPHADSPELFERIMEHAIYWMHSECTALAESCQSLFSFWAQGSFLDKPAQFDAFSKSAKIPAFFSAKGFYVGLLTRPRAAFDWFCLLRRLGSICSDYAPASLAVHQHQAVLAAHHLAETFYDSLKTKEADWISSHFANPPAAPKNPQMPKFTSKSIKGLSMDLPFQLKQHMAYHKSLQDSTLGKLHFVSSIVAHYPSDAFNGIVSDHGMVNSSLPENKPLTVGGPKRQFILDPFDHSFFPSPHHASQPAWTHQRWIWECAIQALEAATIHPESHESIHEFPTFGSSLFHHPSPPSRLPIGTITTTIAYLLPTDFTLFKKLGDEKAVRKSLWRILAVASKFISNLSLHITESSGKLLAFLIEEDIDADHLVQGGWFTNPSVLSAFLIHAKPHFTKILWNDLIGKLKKALIPAGDASYNVIEEDPLNLFLFLSTMPITLDVSDKSKNMDASSSSSSASRSKTPSPSTKMFFGAVDPTSLDSPIELNRKEVGAVVRRYLCEFPDEESKTVGAAMVPGLAPVLRYISLYATDPSTSLEVLKEVMAVLLVNGHDEMAYNTLLAMVSKVSPKLLFDSSSSSSSASSSSSSSRRSSRGEDEDIKDLLPPKWRVNVFEAMRMSLDRDSTYRGQRGGQGQGQGHGGAARGGGGVVGERILLNPIVLSLPSLVHPIKNFYSSNDPFETHPLHRFEFPKVKALPNLRDGSAGLPSTAWLSLLKNPHFFLHILSLLENKEAPTKLGNKGPTSSSASSPSTAAFLELMPSNFASRPSHEMPRSSSPGPSSASSAITPALTSLPTPFPGYTLVEDLDLLLAFLAAFLYFHDKERKSQYKNFAAFKDLRKRVRRLLEVHAMCACAELTLPYGLLLSLPPHSQFTKKTLDLITAEKPSVLDEVLPTMISSVKSASLWQNSIWKILDTQLEYPKANRKIYSVGTNMLIGCASSQILSLFFSDHASNNAKMINRTWTPTSSTPMWVSNPSISPLNKPTKEMLENLRLFKIHVSPLVPTQHPHVRLGWATSEGWNALLAKPQLGVGDVAGTWAYSPVEAKIFFGGSFVPCEPLSYTPPSPPVEFASFVDVKNCTIGWTATVAGREVLLPAVPLTTSKLLVPCISLYSTRILAVDFPIWG